MTELEIQHAQAAAEIQRQLRRFFAQGKKVKIYHGTTNSTRPQSFRADAIIDVSHLNRVLAIDPVQRTIEVEPNLPMDQLVAATLKHGLIPPVVMEFPGITVGGGVQGGAGESSSFKYGLFHQTCLEYEIVLGNGALVTATAEQNSDLYHGAAGAYGSLGVLTRIKLKLVPAKPYVRLTYRRVGSFTEAVQTMPELARGDADFMDGIMFDRSRGTIMTGELIDRADQPPLTFRRPWDEWFHLHARKVSDQAPQHVEYIPLRDYLFRYDRGAFWVGRFGFKLLHLPFNRLTRRWLDRLMHARALYRLLHASNFSYQYFVQDLSLPRDRAVKFMNFVDRELGIYPLWLCPLKVGENDQLSPAHLATDLVVNVGVWGELKKTLADFVTINRQVERQTAQLGGRKVLYAHAYYRPEEFWKIYDHGWYQALRRKYQAETTFPDVFEKTRVVERRRPSAWGGIWRMLRSPRELPVT